MTSGKPGNKMDALVALYANVEAELTATTAAALTSNNRKRIILIRRAVLVAVLFLDASMQIGAPEGISHVPKTFIRSTAVKPRGAGDCEVFVPFKGAVQALIASLRESSSDSAAAEVGKNSKKVPLFHHALFGLALLLATAAISSGKKVTSCAKLLAGGDDVDFRAPLGVFCSALDDIIALPKGEAVPTKVHALVRRALDIKAFNTYMSTLANSRDLDDAYVSLPTDDLGVRMLSKDGSVPRGLVNVLKDLLAQKTIDLWAVPSPTPAPQPQSGTCTDCIQCFPCSDSVWQHVSLL